MTKTKGHIPFVVLVILMLLTSPRCNAAVQARSSCVVDGQNVPCGKILVPVPRQNYDLPLNQTDGGVSGFAGSSVSNSLHAPPAVAPVCSGCSIRPISPRPAPRNSRPA